MVKKVGRKTTISAVVHKGDSLYLTIVLSNLGSVSIIFALLWRERNVKNGYTHTYYVTGVLIMTSSRCCCLLPMIAICQRVVFPFLSGCVCTRFRWWGSPVPTGPEKSWNTSYNFSGPEKSRIRT